VIRRKLLKNDDKYLFLCNSFEGEEGAVQMETATVTEFAWVKELPRDVQRRILRFLNDDGALDVYTQLYFKLPLNTEFLNLVFDPKSEISYRFKTWRATRLHHMPDLDCNSPKVWHNMLRIAMKEKSICTAGFYLGRYMLDYYIGEFRPAMDMQSLINSCGRKMGPMFITETALKAMSYIIFESYDRRTEYDRESNRYTKIADHMLEPIIYWHVKRVRYLQISKLSRRKIDSRHIQRYYLGFQTIRTIRILLDHIVEHCDTYRGVTYLEMESIRMLSQHLRAEDAYEDG
jgi:hypothetical protein